MIELYTSPTPNGYKISVALEELEIPYNVHVVNLQAGDQKKPEFLALNPNGRIPVIVDIENKPYVYAGENYAAWVKNIESDPRVVLKSGNSLYQLKAQRVLNADFFKKFAVAWEEKYGNRPRNENYSETYLFQLSRREER